MFKGRTKLILVALLGLEIVSIPAAAQIVQRVAFNVRPMVTAVEIPTAEARLSRYIVTSNAGFGVGTTNYIGSVQVRVHQSGEIAGGSRFGDAAQLPGDASSCANVFSAMATPVYMADRKTAATPGSVADQAVIFEFRYDAAATPDFTFRPGTASALPAQACDNFSS